MKVITIKRWYFAFIQNKKIKMRLIVLFLTLIL
jgi:hypothetical protein